MTQIGIGTHGKGSHENARAGDVVSARETVPTPRGRRVRAEVRLAQLPAATALRLRITAVAFALLALVLVLVAAPPRVMIPLGFALGTGLVVSGIVALVERRTRDGAVGTQQATRRPQSRQSMLADGSAHTSAASPAAS